MYTDWYSFFIPPSQFLRHDDTTSIFNPTITSAYISTFPHMTSLLGWRVEWNGSFRTYMGTVIDFDKDDFLVEEFVDNEVYTVSLRQITKIKPDLQEFIKFHKAKYLKEIVDDDKEHEYIMEQLNRISEDDKTMALEKRNAIKTEIHSCYLKAKLKYKKEIEAAPFSVGKDEVVESDDDDDDSDSDEEDEDDDDEEDEDEDEDDSDDESESDDDDDDDVKVDVKVHILPLQDIRGFCIRLNASGLSKITTTLHTDYCEDGADYTGKGIGGGSSGAGGGRSQQPKLFYRDQEGDVISIRSLNDLKYAFRACKSAHKGSGGGKKPMVMKLFAEVPTSSTATDTTSTATATATADQKSNSSSNRSYHGTSSPHGSDFKRHSSTNNNNNNSSNHSSSPSSSSSAAVRDSPPSRRASTTASTAVPAPASNYEVIWKKGELLGSGSFGEVFSGINLANGERIAVKEVTFHNYHSNSKKHRRQLEQAKALQQEVKILSSLDHPNIIKYLGTECAKNTLRIFLELANNGTVKDALNEFGAFPESLIRRYTVDIVAGLSFLHGRRFIHRDIKPTNLLISHGVVKLGDFGCSSQSTAAVLGADEGEEYNGNSTDLHGTIIGTAVYMAPEVMQIEDALLLGGAATATTGKDDHKEEAAAIAADGKELRRTRSKQKMGGAPKGYGKKADMWSLGITLCEMATGRAPYKNAAAAIYSICVSRKYPTFPSQFSVDAHAFLGRCLVENPKARASCVELQTHTFLMLQHMDEIRAQTAVHNLNHNLSTVKLELTSEDSFFHSQRHFHATGHTRDGPTNSRGADDFGIQVPHHHPGNSRGGGNRDGSLMSTATGHGTSTVTPRRQYGGIEDAKCTTDDDPNLVSSGFSAMFASHGKAPTPRGGGVHQQPSVDSKESTATYLRHPDRTFRENDDEEDDDEEDDAQYADDKFDTPGTSFRTQATATASRRGEMYSSEYNQYIAASRASRTRDSTSANKSTGQQQRKSSSFITSTDNGESCSDVSDHDDRHLKDEEDDEDDECMGGEGRTDRGDTMRRFKRALAAACGTGDPYAPSVMSTSVDGPASMVSTSNFHTVYSRRRDDYDDDHRNHQQQRQQLHNNIQDSKYDRDCRLEEVLSPGPATPVQWLPSRREQGEDALRRCEQQDRGLDSMNSTFSHLFQR